MKTFRDCGFTWAVWRWVAELPDGSLLMSPSFGSRLDADAARRHLLVICS